LAVICAPQGIGSGLNAAAKPAGVKSAASMRPAHLGVDPGCVATIAAPQSGSRRIHALVRAIFLHEIRFGTDSVLKLAVNILLTNGFSAMRGGRVFLNIVICGYGLVAAVFFTATFLEGWANHGHWTLYRRAGLIATLVWPLVIVFLLLHILATGAYARYIHPGKPA
jgi:hypothetical protein